jgi:hypothetical protein
MSDQPQTPWEKIKSSIAGMLIGILLLPSSFVCVWNASHRAQASEAFKDAVAVANAASAGTKAVYATGKIASSPVGDPEFVRPGNYLSLHRSVQVRAWTQVKKGEDSNKKPIYECKLEWTSSPSSNIGSKDGCKGKPDYTASYKAANFSPDSVTVTAGGQTYAVNPGQLEGTAMPGVKLSSADLSREMTQSGEYFYPVASCASSEDAGCERVSFSGTTYDPAADYTVIGKFANGGFVEYKAEAAGMDGNFLSIAPGNYTAAMKALNSADSKGTMGYFAAAVGMFYLGLVLLTGPVLQLISFIPVIGGFGKGLIQFVFAVFAFVVMGLSFFLIEYWYVVLLAVVALAAFLIYKKKSSPAQPAV